MHMPDKCIIRRHTCAVPYCNSIPVYKLKCRLESDRHEVLFDEEVIIMHFDCMSSWWSSVLCCKRCFKLAAGTFNDLIHAVMTAAPY